MQNLCAIGKDKGEIDVSRGLLGHPGEGRQDDLLRLAFDDFEHGNPFDPLFGDQAIHGTAAGTDRVNDWGSTAQAGQQFVVAEVREDWTAVWFSGAKVWFHNPHGCNTTPARGVTLVGAAGTSPAAR